MPQGIRNLRFDSTDKYPWNSMDPDTIFFRPTIIRTQSPENHTSYYNVEPSEWDRAFVGRGIEICHARVSLLSDGTRNPNSPLIYQTLKHWDLEILLPIVSGQVIHWESYTMINLKQELWEKYESETNKVLARLGGYVEFRQS